MNEVRNSINWNLPLSEQTQVNAFAEAILAAIDALELASGQSGVFSVDGGDLYITETGYRLGDDGEEVSYSGPYVLTGSTTRYRVVVESGSHELELMDVSMENAEYRRSPIEICAGASVELSLAGTSTLTSGQGNRAALNVGEGASLRIVESSGVLEAYGDDDAAGIGGNEDQAAGTIEIDGGTVYAYSEGDGAGIGGGYGGGAGEIIINGGFVFAECLEDDGAGIGCGDGGNGGTVTINGGTVTALSTDDHGAGIGGAEEGRIASVTINGGLITAASEDGAAIGGGYGSSRGGDITINGGIILISDEHTGQNIIGRGNGVYAGEMAGDTVRINGGNILSSNPEAVAPSPRNDAGERLRPFRLTVDESLADTQVLITYGENRRMGVLAYGTEILVYLPQQTDAESIGIQIMPADYTAVEQALAKVPADLSVYTADSVAALQAAIGAVENGLDYLHQAEVDAMAEAIEKALAGLVLLEQEESSENTAEPTVPEDSTEAGDGAESTEEESGGAAATGDRNSLVLYLSLMAGSAMVFLIALARERKQIKE